MPETKNIPFPRKKVKAVIASLTQWPPWRSSIYRLAPCLDTIGEVTKRVCCNRLISIVEYSEDRLAWQYQLRPVHWSMMVNLARCTVNYGFGVSTLDIKNAYNSSSFKSDSLRLLFLDIFFCFRGALAKPAEAKVGELNLASNSSEDLERFLKLHHISLYIWFLTLELGLSGDTGKLAAMLFSFSQGIVVATDTVRLVLDACERKERKRQRGGSRKKNPTCNLTPKQADLI